jgi:hypothetical protein
MESISLPGGNDICFGDYGFFTLPYSKLNIAIAAKKFHEWRPENSNVSVN